jgi:hypothetical protein
MKSKPVSQSSPETGDARPDGADAGAGEPGAESKSEREPLPKARVERDAKGVGAKPRDKSKDDAGARDGKDVRDGKDAPRGPGPLEIELEVSRNRYLGWTVFGIVFGGLLVLKLGTVGKWVGIVLIVLGVLRAWQLLQTFLYAPGTIVVGDNEVTLPRGLCVPKPVKVAPKDVTAVYFLRRSVPWNRSAPVLVVELGAKAMAFPRDWFASEADQRHVVHALLRTRGAVPEQAATASASASAESA